MKELRKIIDLQKGDITKLNVDAIVNAAKSSLLGGSGVDGAIHSAGGQSILDECKEIVSRQGKCSVGCAVITKAGDLHSKYVIHTVGPVWFGGIRNERSKLAECYYISLQLAIENDCKTIAFPNISTGIYQFPKDEAAKIAVETVIKFILASGKIEKVIFICFENDNFNYIKKELVNQIDFI